MLLCLFTYSLSLQAKTENYLRYTYKQNKKLNLVFKYNLSKIKHFTIAKNGIVKHVYDIKNSSLPRTQSLSKYHAFGVKTFRIGQFNKKTIRVVIETTSHMRGSYKINGRKLSIALPLSKNSSRSTIHHRKKKKSVSKKRFLKKRYRQNSKRRLKTIVLDAGHGGRDVGASGKDIREKRLTLSITLKLKTILKRMGYKILLTRSRDSFMNLRQRTEYANRHKGSLFISIHANAAPKKRTPKVRYQGVEVFYLSLKNSIRAKRRRAIYHGKRLYSRKEYKKMTSPWKYAESRRLAQEVKKNLLLNVRKEYGGYDKGIKRKDFWVLLATKMPSILVETGYLTKKEELKNLKNEHYQWMLAEGIARGVNAYYRFY